MNCYRLVTASVSWKVPGMAASYHGDDVVRVNVELAADDREVKAKLGQQCRRQVAARGGWALHAVVVTHIEVTEDKDLP